MWQVKAILTVAANGSTSNRIHLLLTNKWPSKVTSESIQGKAVIEPKESCWQTSELAMRLQPQYHFATGEVYFEREPYLNPDSQASTRFIGLAPFDNPSKEKWFYAMNLDINSNSSVANTRPTNCTKFPYSRAQKRENEDAPQNFFFAEDSVNTPLKKDVVLKGQEKFICIKCKGKGHSAKFCNAVIIKGQEDFLCRACGSKGHSARFCKERGVGSNFTTTKRLKTNNNTWNKKRDSDQCWFCLSNPQVETHLIITVITETYLTLAKGGLVDGHLILVVVPHYSCTRQLQLFIGEKGTQGKSILLEIDHVRESIIKKLAEKKQILISYEIFRGCDPNNQREIQSHMHIQV